MIVVYDVTDRNTFQKVKSWLEEVEVNCDKSPIIILVGNKTDLSEQRQGYLSLLAFILEFLANFK